MSNSSAAQLQRGVIVEFDFAVLSGHALLLDVCGKRFAEEGLTFDATLMARVMGGRSFSSGLNALCAKQQKTVDVPAVIAECNAKFAEALKARLSAVPAGFIEFVKALAARNIKTIVVSRADPEAVQAIFGEQPGGMISVLHDAPNGFGFCSWDNWRRAARKADLHERLCVAVVGSGYSVKGALTSGMSVIVRPNPLTEYQDFGGCDVRIAEYGAGLVEDVTRILRV